LSLGCHYLLSFTEFSITICSNILKSSFSNYFVANVPNLVIEVVSLEDDTGPFPKIEQTQMKIEQTPQVTAERKHFENFGQT
jgi:hypothetical protein